MANIHKKVINNKDFTILTEQINPPIPTRSFDWVAWVDGREGLYESADTEERAIDNLIFYIEENTY